MTILVVIDIKASLLRRYEGRKRTHKAELLVPLSAAAAQDIQRFRLGPNAPYLNDFPPEDYAA